MCCLLILCREETIKGAEGPNKVLRSTKERTKGWHDKKMRKEYNIGDKVLMKTQARKASSRKKRPPQIIYPSSHGVIMLQ